MKKRIVCFLLAMIMVLGMIPNAAVTASAASKLTTSTSAVNILKQYEGFSEDPYQDAGKTGEDDPWYIGYGTQIDDPAKYPNGISEDDALKLLKEHVSETVDVQINKFTATNNLTLSQNQHDALALFSYNCGTGWMFAEGNALRSAVLTGKTGNEFINTIAQYHNGDPSEDNQYFKGLMNRRLSEANMYLNGSYGFYAPTNYTYVILDHGGDEVADSDDQVLAYNTKTSPTLAIKAEPEDEFLGWYVFDGEVDGVIEGEAVTTLDKTTAGKLLVAKFDDGSDFGNASYKINTSSLVSRYVFNETYSREDIEEYKNSMDELAKGQLKKNSTFTVDTEKMVDGVKWIRGVGTSTKGKKLEGWVYMGELPEEDATSSTVLATATITAATLNIREGATTDSEQIGTLSKGTTVNIYAFKTEETETGNKTWGKVNVDGIIGWINLAYADLNEVTDTNDSADGRTGKIVNTDVVNVRNGAGVNYDKITSLKKGTKVTVLKTQSVGSAQWGYVEWDGLKDGYTKGWVYMYYIEVEGLEHSNATGGTSGDIEYTGVVTSNINLNVRETPSVYGKLVRSLPNGTKINIYETAYASNSVKWGRIGDDEWVCLQYVSLTKVNSSSGSTGTTTTTTTQGTVTATTLDIYQNYNSNAEKIGSLKKGDIVTILEKNTEETETGSRIWGRIIDDGVEGWINLAYVELKTVTSVSGSTSTGTSSGSSNANGAAAVIANCLSVNVREAAGVTNAQITKLNSGTAVKVYEQVTKDNAPWAKITWNNGANEGWVCMYYVTMSESSTGTTTEGGTINGTNSNTISATGYVNSNIDLNVRAGAGLGYAKIGSLSKGTKVTVYEQVTADGMIWGRMNYGTTSGWICMSYITVESSSSSGKGVMGTIARCFSAVNVRSAPGTGSALVGTISVGTRVEVFEQKLYSNQYWGRVAQGWICMDYVLLDSELPPGTILDATEATTEATTAATNGSDETVNTDNEISYTINGTINTVDGTPLNVRNDATTDSDRVGTVNNGLSIKILAVKTNNAELWGRIDQYATAGWINLAYVDYAINGYVNTDNQAVYNNANTSSTVKGTLDLNTELTIETVTVTGDVVYGWVQMGDVAGWIPMSRVSDEPVEVIPLYKAGSSTDEVGDLTGSTMAPVSAYSAITGGKVVFKLEAGVNVTIASIKTEGGIVWAELTADGITGWADMSKINFVLSGSVTTDNLNVRNAKNTTDDENILGSLNTGDSVSICELSFDVNGNLWGKVTGNANTALNGGYVSMKYISY